MIRILSPFSSDFLNPLVIKEVRQELRTKSFFHLYLWPPLVYVLIFFLFAVSTEDKSELARKWAGDAVVWGILATTLFFYLPRRAFSSFGKEESANALELIQLSGMSSFEIVWGKWIALASQMFLFVTVFLPFFFFNYLVSGGELFVNLLILLLLSLITLTVLSIGISSSANRYGSGKGSPPIVFTIIGGLVLISAISSLPRMMKPFMYGGVDFWGIAECLALIVFAGAVNLHLLLHAASSIALTYENYAFFRRFIAFVPLLSAPVFVLALDVAPEFIFFLAASLLVVAAIPELFAAPHQRIIRENIPFRRYISFQGWPGGVQYLFIICCTAGVLSLFLLPKIGLFKALLLATLGFAGLYLPFAAWTFLNQDPGRLNFVRYAIVQAAVVTFVTIALSLDLTFLSGLHPFFLLGMILDGKSATRVAELVPLSVLVGLFEFFTIVGMYRRLSSRKEVYQRRERERESEHSNA